MIDPNSTLRTFLVADTTLAALVSTRIYAGRDVPPPGVTPAGTGPLIAFRIRGGAGEYGGRQYEDALVIPSVQFKCYGEDEIEAYQVYRALADALHNGHGVGILHAVEEGVGQSLEEPDTEWRFVLAFFAVMVRAS